jgi:hypothetical protein
MLTEAELLTVTEAASRIPLTSSVYVDNDFGTCLVSTVVDFQTHTTAVERALAHFEEHRGERASTLGDFERLFLEYPDTKAGNTELAEYLFGYKMWTRVGLLRSLVRFMRRIGVSDISDLRAWAEKSEFERDFEGQVRFVADGRTNGLGPAVYNWLVMRLGVETVKPDVRLHRFVETAVGRRVSDSDLVSAIESAAKRIGASPRQLDWSIWEAMRP